MWYAALIGAVLQVLGTVVGRILISLGVAVVAYKGMDTSIGWAKDHFFGAAGSMPSQAVQAFGVMEIDTAVEMICSALLMRLTFKGMSSGVMKSFVAK